MFRKIIQRREPVSLYVHCRRGWIALIIEANLDWEARPNCRKLMVPGPLPGQFLGDTMNVMVRAEDIMTPRRLLTHAPGDIDAAAAADQGGFDAVPLLRRDGLVREFWSRADRKRILIARRHRTPHDSTIDRLLPKLGAHVVQFVYYRSEMVGLVDASDLNKPIARIVWLQPMLQLERAILDAVRCLNIDDEQQAAALDSEAASTRRRQAKAQQRDLEMPLLEYAQFPSLLRAAVRLGISQLSEGDITELNEVRKRAAHGGYPVIDDRTDCGRLIQALEIAWRAVRSIDHRFARRGR
jgi:hypothetical protein